jgi:Na+/H+-dicarboxylate symporter/ABC-type amino acid transport substrate-binding protein
MTTDSQPKKRRLGIASQVFIGLGLGILVGVFFGEEVGFLKIGGDAFIALLQITVIPYVMVALITSLGRLTLDEARELGLKAGSVLLVLWAIGLVVVLATPLAFPDWPSASFFSISEVEEAKPVDFLKLYIPSNVFFALSNAVVPAIVVFSILFGLALIRVGEKRRLLDPLSTIGEVLMTITGFVGKLAPYGVFAITASAAGTIEVGDLGRLQVYIVIYVVLALILSFWVIPGLIAALTPLRYGAILHTFRGPLITAFATGSVLIVLPVLAADGKRLIESTDGGPAPPSGQAESSIDILIPAAYPFPSLGGLLALVFVLFGGWYVGSSVSVDQYPTLAIAGVASLFGGTVLALPFLFDLLRLPADLFQVFVTVDVIGSRFGTLLAALNILAIALIGTYALQGRLTLRPVPLFRLAVLSVALLAAALIGIRAFYTYAYVEPYTKGQLLASLRLIENPQPHTVYREPPPDVLKESGGPASLERIKQRGVLRACYVPGDYPSAFLNDAGDLVGFDIEMAHRFARYMGVPLEFLPAGSIAAGKDRLEAGLCDVFMSLIWIFPSRTEEFSMTAPVHNVPVGLIVPDYRREAFRRWADIRAIEGLRVAILDDPSDLTLLHGLLPNATSVPYRNKEELDQILAAGAPDVDAIATFAEEAAAWTLRHPEFSLVAPAPTFYIPSGYAVAHGNTDLLVYLDAWLLNAKVDGTVDELYRYWMLGQVKQTQPPRWSLIRNVLGWID